MSFPFPSREIRELKKSMPDPDILEKVLCCIPEKEFDWISRLWLSEGIPFAFQEEPALFEAMREWLGDQLDIDPKCITMIGSGRIGFSMAPMKFGQEYGDKSDLDLSIVSGDLYERLKENVLTWMDDYNCRRPRSEWNRKYARGNYEFFYRSLTRGFVDHQKIPYVEPYAVAQLMGDRLFALGENLRLIDSMPEFSKVTARVYRDWNAFVQQMRINLRATKNKLVALSAQPMVAPTRD